MRLFVTTALATALIVVSFKYRHDTTALRNELEAWRGVYLRVTRRGPPPGPHTFEWHSVADRHSVWPAEGGYGWVPVSDRLCAPTRMRSAGVVCREDP